MTEENGYLTVEASILMPIVFGVLLLIIELWFFKYDCCLMDLDIGKVSVEASFVNLKAGDRVAYVQKRSQELSYKKYIGWKNTPIEVSVSHNKLKIAGGGSLSIPNFRLRFVGRGARLTSSNTYTNKLQDYKYTVRLIRKSHK